MASSIVTDFEDDDRASIGSMSPGPVSQIQGVEGLDHNNIAGGGLVYVQIQDSDNADTEMMDLAAGNPTESYEEAPPVMTVLGMIEQVDVNSVHKSVQFNPYTGQTEVMRNTKVWMKLPYPLLAEGGFKEVHLELKHADEERHPEDIVHCGCLEKGKEKHQGKVAQFNQFPYEILESDGNVTLTTNEEKGKRQVIVRGTATRLQFRFKAFSTCQKNDGGKETARKWRMMVRYPYLHASKSEEFLRIIPLQVMHIKPLESKSKDAKSKRGVREIIVVHTEGAENDVERENYIKKLQRIQSKQMQQWKTAPLAALKFQVEQYRTLGAEL